MKFINARSHVNTALASIQNQMERNEYLAALETAKEVLLPKLDILVRAHHYLVHRR
ncbi:MAG: hypothetical protein J3T61_00580 [Candidatus Brocadiales bacterium]|nr:hypothetical protein [Candidatus Bathyanammoxibius sp.]